METLQVHPVFLGLTRPPMWLGVTLDYFCGCCLIVLCVLIVANNPWFLLTYLPLHLLGMLACKVDPHCFHLMLCRGYCAYAPNGSWWGCACYEAY